jgi:hypothetical protein
MATADAFRREPASVDGSVGFQRLRRVLRTARFKPAMARGSEQRVFGGRQDQLINPHEQNAEGGRKNAEKMQAAPERVFILHSAFFLLHWA